MFDIDKIMPDATRSLRDGGIEPLGKYRNNILSPCSMRWGGVTASRSLDDAVGTISKEGIGAILYGDSEPLTVNASEYGSSAGNQLLSWEGVSEWIERDADEDSKRGQKWREQFIVYRKCSLCHGTRLKSEALQFKIGGKSIADVSAMSIAEFSEWMSHVEEHMTDKERKIAREIVKEEIRERLRFLLDVGLGYLSLSRSSRSISGGESQRIRLATQIGSKLVNVLYILDEPSIGLHQRDNRRLIESLKELRDAGNSVIVVEHDEDMMRAADYIVDVGPLAGRRGGNIVAAGTLDEVLASHTLTADYLNGLRSIPVPADAARGQRRVAHGARRPRQQPQNIDVSFPLGKFICVTGVSGSGKSTLVNETLRPILSRHLYRSFDQALECDGVEGIEHIDKLVVVDQSPIGRTPRSNPATYSGVFFGHTQALRVYARCSDTRLQGRPFLVQCQGRPLRGVPRCGSADYRDEFPARRLCAVPACGGRRYNRETLEVRYKGKNINDVLNMTVNMAVEFFENIPSIWQKLHAMRHSRSDWAI